MCIKLHCQNAVEWKYGIEVSVIVSLQIAINELNTGIIELTYNQNISDGVHKPILNFSKK